MTETRSHSHDTREAQSLDTQECEFLRRCSFFLPTEEPGANLGSKNSKRNKQKIDTENNIVEQALQALDTYHMCILHNALSSADLELIEEEYQALLDFNEPSAIGEKDASRRSATRLFNCACQRGPNSDWSGWKDGAEHSRRIVGVGSGLCGSCGSHEQSSYSDYKQRPNALNVWKKILKTLDFEHVARVEVVTSHVGCRDQAWHIDGVHGLTVIFALADVDLPKGPTQLDFSIPFNSLSEGGQKVKVQYKSLYYTI
jgi:hypothetical protein